MRLDHRKLIDERRIDGRVSIALIREDVSLFALSHIRPAADRFPCAVAPGPVIAYDPSEQPHIAGGHTVMLVDVERRKRGYIDLEFLIRGDRFGEELIHAVNAFDDEDILRSEMDQIAHIFTGAAGKIIMRHVYGLSV